MHNFYQLKDGWSSPTVHYDQQPIKADILRVWPPHQHQQEDQVASKN